ncbi:MAG: IS1634 family transposase [Bacteroidia bacterium]|nr:IS1634 family transposase [Bacteroidia bacterium]
MFIRLAKAKYNKDEFVYLVEAYRDESGKPKQRVIRSFGTLAELTRENPNALAELKGWAKEETERLRDDRYISLILDMAELQNGQQRPLNYGYVFLQSIYNDLRIPEFVQEYQSKTNIEYPLNDILQLMVYSRCLKPSSKKKTFEGKGQYFFELADFRLDDVYRSLGQLCAMKEELTLHLHRRIQETQGRDCSLVFYDVTNYYFESDKLEGLRQKGVSKENRETGIVQMGLFIDNAGIPITYELFPGNTNDMSTMKPLLQKIKKAYGLGKITIVADKGNNTGENLAYIDGEADFYIISQRIRARGTELANIVLDPEGYMENGEGTFKSKSIERERVVKRQDGSISMITEHLLCFWSLNEERYQRAKRGFLDEKIEKFIENPSLLNASNSFGIKKYFKKVVVDKKTGEILNAKPSYIFDQAKYERDLALDGYYCIVTNDLSLEPLDIIHHYHQLSKIEESFKVTKSDLEGRPVYVWTDEHIQGHFLTCYLALVLYRLLQQKLDRSYPIHQLKEALASANAVRLAKDICLLHDAHAIVNELATKFGMSIGYKYMRYENLKKELKLIR